MEKIKRELATLSAELEHSAQASAQPAELKPLLWRAKAASNDLMNRMLELDGVSVSAEQVGQHGGFRSHVMADLCMHGCDCHETAGMPLGGGASASAIPST